MMNGERAEHFFILGAAKCGTTSLASYLAQHPSIVMSVPKEPIFFEAEYEKGLEHYWNTCFGHWNGEPFAGEARHRNLYLPYVPRRLHRSYPRAKLIVILRNPVDRAYSHYLHRKRHNRETHSFEEAIKADLTRMDRDRSLSLDAFEETYRKHLRPDGYNARYLSALDSGYYAIQIERYLELFGREQILILFVEDLKKEPARVYSRILSFLHEGLSAIDVDFSVLNRQPNRLQAYVSRFRREHPRLRRVLRGVMPRRIKQGALRAIDFLDTKTPNPDGGMSAEMRSWLTRHYEPHIAHLERLTGRDLSSWTSRAEQSPTDNIA